MAFVRAFQRIINQTRSVPCESIYGQKDDWVWPPTQHITVRMKIVNIEDIWFCEFGPMCSIWLITYKHNRISASSEWNMIRCWRRCNARKMRERAEGFAGCLAGNPWAMWPIYYNHLSWHDINTTTSSINIQSQFSRRRFCFNSSPLMTMNKLSVEVDEFCLRITFLSLLYCYNIPSFNTSFKSSFPFLW